MICIKDMEMPDRCFDCPINSESRLTGEWYCNKDGDSLTEGQEFTKRPDWCPLEEVET